MRLATAADDNSPSAKAGGWGWCEGGGEATVGEERGYGGTDGAANICPVRRGR
jgi:hypothetical protein